MTTFTPLNLPQLNTGPRVGHPLEPLTSHEVRTAVDLLKSAGKVTPTTRFISVALAEPAKGEVHAGAPATLSRGAFVVLFDNATNTCHEATLSLTEERITTWKQVPGVQPTMTIDEQTECEQAVIASPLFKAALLEHTGVDDTSLVMVDIWSAGNYGDAEDSSLRLARPLCFLRADPTDNGYVRPIEGIRPVVDLNRMEVIWVEQHGKPLEINQPEGPGFEVDGYQVSWQKWKFVIGFNAREGLTLHHLRYQDGEQERSILYR